MMQGQEKLAAAMKQRDECPRGTFPVLARGLFSCCCAALCALLHLLQLLLVPATNIDDDLAW